MRKKHDFIHHQTFINRLLSSIDCTGTMLSKHTHTHTQDQPNRCGEPFPFFFVVVVGWLMLLLLILDLFPTLSSTNGYNR